MSVPASFGLWIRQRRRLLDLTQEQLADKVGCSHSAIRKIEGDERRPSRQVAELLAEALQIAPDERSLFLRIARQELRIDQLDAISAPRALPLSVLVRAPAPQPAAPSAPAAEPAPQLRLPVPPTPLVGRDVEVVQIASTLLNDECRLLTLVGPGGIGKSRLAIAVAQRLAGKFDGDGQGGVAFAPLAGLASADQLAVAIANALELGQYGHADPVRQLQVFLRDKRLLLVLDSMEHLLDGGDVLVSELLRSAADLKILATSREQLNLQGEWLFNVRGLSVPEPAANGAALDGWEHSSAMRLFVQSARRANVSFAPDPNTPAGRTDIAAIAHICRLVEGMPLAIELAASWVRVLNCAEIAAEIERDWGFLSGATRDMPARHRSLRAVFDQSWALLGEGERRILRELSIFRRGFRRDAAARVARASLLDLSSLAAKSLVHPAAAAQDRFEVQELVRQYAAEQLAAVRGGNGAQDAAGGTQDDVARRHAEYFRDLAAEIEPQLHGAAQVEALDRLESEHENLRAALAWFAARDPQSGLRLANALWWFWFVRGYWKEARAWQARLLDASAGQEPTPARAAALVRAANMAWMVGDSASASLLDEALRTAEACGDETSLVLADYVMGQVATHRDSAHSSAAFERSRVRARAHGDRWSEARALYRLGINTFVDDDLPGARRLYEESLSIFRSLGDLWGMYATLSDLGGTSRRAGDLDAALKAAQESLVSCRKLGFRQGVALELLSLGVVHWGRGEFAEARRRLSESRRAFAEFDNRRGVADAHLHLGNTARWEGDLHEAAVQYEHALALSREAAFAPAIATALHGLATTALAEGDHARTRALLRETVATERESPGLRFYLAAVLETAAALAEREGFDAAAARFLGAAQALRVRYTAALAPVELAAHAELADALRARLGDDACALALAQGAALGADEAMDALLEYLTPA